MPHAELAPISPAQISWRSDEPEATNFGDCYFSRQAGPAESRYVFRDGNRLPARFSALPNRALFVIGETGFGTGLNFLEAAQCFLETAPADAQLYFISCEKYPLSQTDLSRALASWPNHQSLSNALLAHYPPACPGFHDLRLHPRITLQLLLGDAGQLLPLCTTTVDAWFLDGFAPAKNPDLWQPSLFSELARLSRAGTTLATFTAAGFVRRGLIAAGFTMQKAKGFGHKRDMLVGQMQGAFSSRQSRQPTVAIAGAGLAGCTLAHRLANAGCKVLLCDGQGIAQGASGNLAGVLYTTPSGNLYPQNRFYQHSFLAALRWLKQENWPQTPAHGRLNGIIQIAAQARRQQKHRAAFDSGYWPESVIQPAANWPEGSIVFPAGGYLNPPAWCEHLVNHANIHVYQQHVHHLQYDDEKWGVYLANSDKLDADAVVLANAEAAADLLDAPLPIKLIRGQVTQVQATAASRQWQQAICHKSYYSPAINGQHCVGASFDLHDPRRVLKPEDDAVNLATLREWLPALWDDLGGENIDVVTSRVELRCQSKDFLPLVGAVDATKCPGLYLNIAHGSRGLTATPLAADVLASALLGLPAPTDAEVMATLSPSRFAKRHAKKQPSA